MNSLEVECSKCKVFAFCPKRGSSPVVLKSSKRIYCKIIGGYGRTPISTSILSEESKEKFEKNGPCLTLVEIPIYDADSDKMYYELTKIFAPPVLHERESVQWPLDQIYPKSGGHSTLKL